MNTNRRGPPSQALEKMIAEGRSAQRVDGSRSACGRPEHAVMSVATLEQEAVVPIIGQRNGEADAVGLQLPRYGVHGNHLSV